jgi:hypothetical protein
MNALWPRLTPRSQTPNSRRIQEAKANAPLEQTDRKSQDTQLEEEKAQRWNHKWRLKAS